jgi:hypothetical protein
MEFKYDFLQNQKIRWYYIVFGILWILLYTYYELIKDESVFKFIFYLIIGLFVISRGIGAPFEKLFGKKYIYVSDDDLHIKLRVLKKGIKTGWKEISSLELWPGKILITTRNKNNYSADLRDVEPQIRHDFLQTIIQLANEKGVDSKKHGYLKNIQ